MELCQETKEWETFVHNFIYTFQFAYEQPTVDIALKTIKEKIFANVPLEVAYSQPCTVHSHKCCEIVQHWMTCYNLSKGPEDDLTNINDLESEGSHAVEGSEITSEELL